MILGDTIKSLKAGTVQVVTIHFRLFSIEDSVQIGTPYLPPTEGSDVATAQPIQGAQDT